MRLSRLFALGCLLLATLSPAIPLIGQENAAPSEAQALEEIKKQCDERNRPLGAALSEGKEALDKFESLLGSLEAEAKKEPELATAVAGVPPAEAIQQAHTARDSARLYLGLAEGLRTRATQELAAADKEPQPARKLEHYKQALDLMRHSDTLAQRAIADIKPPEHESRPFHFSSRAFDQVRAIADSLAENNPAANLAPLQKAWDSAATRANATVTSGQGTPFFSGSLRSYSNGIVTLSNGAKVDVRPIEQAAAAGAPQHQPLIRPVPSPASGPGYVVDPAVSNRARAQAGDPKVGGVALQIAFLTLEAAGVGGFRSGSYLEGIDQTVLFSVKRLLTRLQPYAADQRIWASLPEELRFPGNIEQLVGFVLDAPHRDLILIGVPARRPEARIDIDSLILGLRAAWRDNASPYVSLDPSPLDPFGPQLTRVGGIPADSQMAHIMLDADYRMKEILLGRRPTGIAAYKNVIQLRQQDSAQALRPWQARFWFYPKPLSPYSVNVSSSGRTVTFNAELQVLSEQMQTQGAVFVGSDASGGTEEAAAFEFTRILDTLAASATADPQALFSRLRGLTGIVTLGALLRRSGIDYPALQQLAGLPYRRLEGREAVPKQYPGVVTEFDLRAQNRLWRISIGGGVELVPRTRASSHDTAVNLLAAQVERQVDAGELQERPTIRVSVPLVLARNSGSVLDQQVDALLLQGSNAFRDGRYAEAVRFFRDAAAADPSSLDANVNLAFAQSRLGREQDARAAIRTARLLEPDDETARLMEFAIRRNDRSWPGPEDRRRAERTLSTLYTRNAGHALARKDNAQALAWAGDALQLGPEESVTEAYLIRGFAGLGLSPESPSPACTDLRKAWSATEYVAISGGGYDNDARIHALASLGLAHCSLMRQIEALRKGEPGPALFRAIADDLQQAITYMRPAQKEFPDLSLIFSATLSLEANRYFALKNEYRADAQRSETARLVSLAEETLRRFPNAVDVYSSAGQLYLDLGDPEHAASTCSRWLASHPGDTACLAIRGEAFARSGKCPQAREDFSNATRDPQFKAVPAVFQSRCGPL